MFAAHGEEENQSPELLGQRLRTAGRNLKD